MKPPDFNSCWRAIRLFCYVDSHLWWRVKCANKKDNCICAPDGVGFDCIVIEESLISKWQFPGLSKTLTHHSPPAWRPGCRAWGLWLLYHSTESSQNSSKRHRDISWRHKSILLRTSCVLDTISLFQISCFRDVLLCEIGCFLFPRKMKFRKVRRLPKVT